MRIAVRCNNECWAYECNKVLAKPNVFEQPGLCVPGLELHCKDNTIRYVVPLHDPSRASMVALHCAMNGFGDCYSEPGEWSEVVTDMNVFKALYPNFRF